MSPAEIAAQTGEGFEIALVVAGEPHDHVGGAGLGETLEKLTTRSRIVEGTRACLNRTRRPGATGPGAGRAQRHPLRERRAT